MRSRLSEQRLCAWNKMKPGKKFAKSNILTDQQGATAVYVGLIISFLVMLTALAVDVGHLYGVRNELQNASDAGALAGASLLFDDDGNLTVVAAIDEAERVSGSNRSGIAMVDEIEVETGHWSFINREFTANPSTTQVEWKERPADELDLDINFINAVRVRTNRSDTPSFFANIFGKDYMNVSADAVAWIGFAGTLFPAEMDQPIAICKESIIDETNAYICNMGRMLNSGGNTETHNTGGWTNFTQPCETSSASDMQDLVCQSGNTEKIQFGGGIGATGGVQDTTFNSLFDCWAAETNKLTDWNMTLPVVECPGNNVSNCANLIGAVNLNVIWMIHQNDPLYNDVPRNMTAAGFDPWSCPEETDGFTCWRNFVDYFDLQNVNGPPITVEDYATMYQKKNIFFLTDCNVHEPVGQSGGENFGVLAEIPRLVE